MGVDGLKFHGIESVCTLEDLGSMGVKLHDLWKQDKCGMRASMTAELVFQERHSSDL